MKPLLFILFILFSFNSLSQSVIASAGKTSSGNNFIISWTVGEVAIATLSNADKTLTQGFHQPLLVDIMPTSIEENAILDMIAYPNPAYDKVLFKGGDPNGVYHIRLVDKLGRILEQKSVSASELELEMSKYDNGTYLIEVVEENTDRRRIFNIIKSIE